MILKLIDFDKNFLKYILKHTYSENGNFQFFEILKKNFNQNFNRKFRLIPSWMHDHLSKAEKFCPKNCSDWKQLEFSFQR